MSEYLVIAKTLTEISILWFAFYVILVFAQGTRAVQVFKGIILIGIFFIVTQQLQLNTINWIFTKLFAISVITMLIIFQPELRRGLASIGQHKWSDVFMGGGGTLKEVVKAVGSLSRRKIGALISIERESRLTHYVESGVEIDANVSTEILITIFMPNTPLHDGGAVISGNRVSAAGCLFPLTQNPKVSRTLGTRHRAALGLSEETDAVVVIVSEETGMVSVAVKGRLINDLNKDALERVLVDLCGSEKRHKNIFLRK